MGGKGRAATGLRVAGLNGTWELFWRELLGTAGISGGMELSRKGIGDFSFLMNRYPTLLVFWERLQ